MQKYEQDIEQLLAEGNIIQIKPQGYSMYPLFLPGRDEAIIAPVARVDVAAGVPMNGEKQDFVDPSRLKRGDVVLYRRDKSDDVGSGILVLHRIWQRKGDRFYLVGDNQKEIEGPLRPDQMRGILVGVVRKGRKISVKNPVYRVLTGIWLVMRPVRPVISRTVARIKRIGRVEIK